MELSSSHDKEQMFKTPTVEPEMQMKVLPI
jgi:hypothetical protein